MAKIDELIIELRARTDQLDAAMSRTQNQIQKVASSVTNSQRSIERQVAATSRGISASSAAMAGAIGAVGYSLLNFAKNIAINLPLAADRVNMLQKRIELFTESSAQASQVYDRLLATALKTGTSIEPAVQLYTRLAATLGQAGYSTEEILRITETFSKTLRIAGASTAEAESATLQFAQAMGSGVLRGEELNALMESNSAFALRLAKSLGVPIGELRKLGEQGVLTSEIMAKAMQEMGGEVDKTSDKLGVGLAGAVNNLSTAFSDFIDNIDEALGLIENLAKAINWLAEKMKNSGGSADEAAARYKKYNRIAQQQLGMTEAQIKAEETLNKLRQNPNVSFTRPVEDLTVHKAPPGTFDVVKKTAAQMLDEQKSKGTGTSTPVKKATKEADDYTKSLDKVSKSLDDMAKESQRVDDLSRDLGLTFSSAFEDAIVNGAKFSDVLAGIEKDIIRILARKGITEPLANSIGGFNFSSIFSGIGSMFGGGSANSGVYGPSLPGRAIGGGVQAGVPYVVGEKRPEIFVPQSAGRIVPSTSGMKGGGNMQVTVINNSGSRISTQQQKTDNGMSLKVMVDEAVAGNLKTQGSRTNQAFSQLSRQALVRR